MSEEPKAGWWKRHWVWAVPLGCLSSLLVCAGLVTLLAALVFGLIKSSGAYEQSLQAIRSSSQVRARLGQPIEPGLLVNGQVNLQNASGRADISYSVAGPLGSATAFVEAEKTAGRWTMRVLVVELTDSGERIDLLAEPNSSEAEP